MKKTQEILGLPIISISDGIEVGRVKNIIVNAEKGAIDYIVVDSGIQILSAKIIPTDNILGIGEYAVTIENGEAINDLSKIPAAIDLLQKNIQVKGTKVLTKKGRLIGEIGDIYVDEDESCKIIGLEYIADITQKKIRVIPRESVITLGKNLVVVIEDVEQTLMDKAAELGIGNRAEIEKKNISDERLKSDQRPNLRESSDQRPNLRESSDQRPNLRESSDQRPNLRETSDQRPNLRESSDQRPNLRSPSDQRNELRPLDNRIEIETDNIENTQGQNDLILKTDKIIAREGDSYFKEIDNSVTQSADNLMKTNKVQTGSNYNSSHEFNDKGQDQVVSEGVSQKQSDSMKLEENLTESKANKVDTSKETASSSQSNAASLFEQRQKQYLSGRKATKTITTASGTVIIKEGNVITEDVIESAKQSGKLIELVMNNKA